MPIVTKAQDLQENLHIAEAVAREIKRDSDPILGQRRLQQLDEQIRALHLQIKKLEEEKVKVGENITTGSERLKTALQEVERRKGLIEEFAGKGDIARLKKLIEAQLLLAVGSDKKGLKDTYAKMGVEV